MTSSTVETLGDFFFDGLGCWLFTQLHLTYHTFSPKTPRCLSRGAGHSSYASRQGCLENIRSPAKFSVEISANAVTEDMTSPAVHPRGMIQQRKVSNRTRHPNAL